MTNDSLALPVLTMDQFKAMLDAEPDRVQRMVEAGWEVLEREGHELPEVETMTALFEAMVRAR